MGLVLAALGADVLAANLFVAATEAPLFRTFEVASAAGTCLGATGRYADAIETSAPLVRDADPRVRDAGNLVLNLAVLGKPLPQPVSEDLLDLMHDLIEIEIVQDRRERAATAYYNFGQLLRALGRYELALAAYRAAAEYNAGYLEQDYYNRELGGLHHLLRDHAAAASAYRKALQHGGDPAQLAPLLADSLLLSGCYRESIEALENWDAPDSSSAALAAIVGVVADLVIRTTGLTEQTRHEPLPDKDVLHAVPKACHEFLTDLDALDHRYWLAAAEVLPDEDALPWGTLLAHITNDPRFWAMATATAHRLDSPLVYGLAEQAYRRCADEYLNTLNFLCDPNEEGESWFDLSRDETAKLFDEMYERLASRPDHRPSPTMRLVPPPA